MTPACLLVIQHEPEAPIAWLGQWWAERGIDVDICRGDLDHPIPAHLDPQVHAGLVVLGGYMGANDDDEHAWLTPTKALIRESIAAGIPFLGICLGHHASVAGVGLSGGIRLADRWGPIRCCSPLRVNPIRSCTAPTGGWRCTTTTSFSRRHRCHRPRALRRIGAALRPASMGPAVPPETSPEVFATWATESDGAAFATALARSSTSATTSNAVGVCSRSDSHADR